MTDWPYKFPHHAEVIAEDARRIQKMPVSERLRRLFAIIDGGQSLLSLQKGSAHHLQRAQDEEKWRQIHREVFRRHGF